MARLAIAKGFLAEYAKLEKSVQSAVESAIGKFAEHTLPDAQYAALYSLACGMTVEEAWAEVAQLLPAQAPAEPVDPADLVAAMERTPGQVTFVAGQEELQRILAHPFAAWRTFLHPAQRKIAYRKTYSGPAQVTGGAGTGKTVTALHRAACLAGACGPAGGDR